MGIEGKDKQRVGIEVQKVRACAKIGTKEKALLLKASFGEQPGKELHNLSESY
jgi:hypothetical protein